jgi:hypothetical protein
MDEAMDKEPMARPPMARVAESGLPYSSAHAGERGLRATELE